MSDITANVVVSMPSQLFTLARSFKAVANGKIYIGQIDTDPTIPANQIQVYIEGEDGDLIPVSQPILINAGGYPVYNGQITKFVTVKGHSMSVYDAYGVQQFYFPNILGYEPDQFASTLNLSWLRGMNGFLGGDVYPPSIGVNANVGEIIPAGTRYIRLNGVVMMLSAPLSSPLTIASYDTTSINGSVELYPVTFFHEVNSGWKIAQNDTQLQRLLGVGGNIILSSENYTLSGDFTVNSDLTIKSKWKKTKFTVNQFWLRTPLTASIRQPYDIIIDGSIDWEFHSNQITMHQIHHLQS
ncbi:Head binding [Enterobacter hormaechei]|nr:hypothetical protein ASV05_04395 [Enterobacter hormaechei subsp. xiangfangensis]CDL33158.1 Phage tail fibers [Enterobacter hormaechei]DAR48964.1 MAG TPA: tail protein [Caudoviricetes sp.]KTJ87033.1 hypothetical protein ASU73_18870 [Enterobacter hormaechei subsp. xiangfangensis]KTK24061.1 hypothetical protein ASU65_07590 [Enterobacter hormaechei subsp. xiangfangensis]